MVRLAELCYTDMEVPVVRSKEHTKLVSAAWVSCCSAAFRVGPSVNVSITACQLYPSRELDQCQLTSREGI